jgi:predicted dinucleotide-binding enzyme
VVKSLNHLGYFKFEKSRRPHGTPGRIGMAAAGNDRSAVAAVLELIDSLGFDPVDAGNLESGMALQPGGPIFGAGHNAKELSNLLSREAVSVQNATDYGASSLLGPSPPSLRKMFRSLSGRL